MHENMHLEFTGESNPMQQLMLTMLGGIYQFDRAMILERHREGIALTKLKGKYKGKPVNRSILKLYVIGY
ncbi:MAG: recombinase family protein [Colwellia sp.]|nr:recombinase family protein [Colwellia sp.]NQY88168.1 recombinase family protein [Colwellia sp.]